MPPNDRIHTSEDTLNILREKAKEDDNFVVKVSRRAHPGVGPTVLATLSGARVEHFTNPELWVPALVGGGKIALQGYHVSDMNRSLGGVVQFEVEGEAKHVQTDVVGKTDWRGPAVLDYPRKDQRRQEEQLPLYGSPPGPNSGHNATSSNQPWERSPGGGFTRQNYGNQSNGSDNEWRQNAALLEAERRALEKERLEVEKQKHKDELEAQRKAHEADMRALRSEVSSALQAKPTGPDSTQLLVAEMMKQAVEDRREAARQAAEDRRAAEAQRAEDRRAAAEAAARAEARFLSLLEKMNDKPKENPLDIAKTLLDLVGKKGPDAAVEAQMKVMHSMSEMMSSQIGVAMDFVGAAADLQLGAQGEKEPGWVKGLESVVKTVGSMAKGASIRRAPPQQQQQLPQQAQQPQQAQRAPQKENPPVAVQVENAIRAKIPVEQIAAALVQHFEDPSIKAALIESQGDLESYVRRRLGNWINEDPASNPVYLNALFTAIEAAFIKAGFIPGDAPDQVGPGPEDAEYEESDEDPEPEEASE